MKKELINIFAFIYSVIKLFINHFFSLIINYGKHVYKFKKYVKCR